MPIFFCFLLWGYFARAMVLGAPRPRLYLVRTEEE